jgi:hybrid polyketide synthase/nonribosomal peptide synthetase ACE1
MNRDVVLGDLDSYPQHIGTRISHCILANRIFYSFDWREPSLNIDTACSSSLVGVHQAVQSLRSGESEQAVVVGVNLVFGPDMLSYMSSVSPLLL